MAGAVAQPLTQPGTLHMCGGAVCCLATFYLVGEVVGSLVFGKLSDRLGRKNLFMRTSGSTSSAVA